MKKYYVAPAIQVLVAIAHDMLATSMPVGGNTSDEGITTNDVKSSLDVSDAWKHDWDEW